MNLGNAIKMAFKSLATSKMRTFLTMLGVIIGVLTVALLTTVTDGATAAVIGNLKRESTMSLILVNKETSVKTFDETIASAKQDEKLGAFDYSVVIRNSANVNSASKVVSIMTGKDANGNPAPSEYYKRGVAVTTQIYAVRANYDIVRNLKYEGEWLSEDGEIVVDREFIDVFFGENVQTGDVIGQTVKLGGETLLSIKINTSSEATQSEIYNAIRLTLAGYLSLPINNLSKLYNGTATPDEISEIYADIDAALSTIYQDENDGVYEIRIAPTAFVADSALVSGFKLALMQAGITDENVLDSVVVSDYFDSSFEREYRIVGVAEESSAFSMNSSGDMEETLQSMGTEFAALTEAMARSAQGRVYMLISDDNARVIDQTTGSADNLIIYRNAPGWYHPGRSGAFQLGKNVVAVFGELHPQILKAFDIKTSVVACEVYLDAIPMPKNKAGKMQGAVQKSAYQAVTRDFAFVMDKAVEAQKLLATIQNVDKNLIQNVSVFDVYEGDKLPEGKKQIAVQVVIQSMEKTLTDKEIETLSTQILNFVSKATGAELRK